MLASGDVPNEPGPQRALAVVDDVRCAQSLSRLRPRRCRCIRSERSRRPAACTETAPVIGGGASTRRRWSRESLKATALRAARRLLSEAVPVLAHRQLHKVNENAAPRGKGRGGRRVSGVRGMPDRTDLLSRRRRRQRRCQAAIRQAGFGPDFRHPPLQSGYSPRVSPYLGQPAPHITTTYATPDKRMIPHLVRALFAGRYSLSRIRACWFRFQLASTTESSTT